MTIIEVDGSALAFGNTVSLYIITFHNNFKGRNIGLWLYIIPYGNNGKGSTFVKTLLPAITDGVYKTTNLALSAANQELTGLRFYQDGKYHLTNWYESALHKNKMFFITFTSSPFLTDIHGTVLFTKNINLQGGEHDQNLNVVSLYQLPELKRVNPMLLEKLDYSEVLAEFFFCKGITVSQQAGCLETLAKNNPTIRPLIDFLKEYNIHSYKEFNAALDLISTYKGGAHKSLVFIEKLRSYALLFQEQNYSISSNLLISDNDSAVVITDKIFNDSIELLHILDSYIN